MAELISWYIEEEKHVDNICFLRTYANVDVFEVDTENYTLIIVIIFNISTRQEYYRNIRLKILISYFHCLLILILIHLPR